MVVSCRSEGRRVTGGPGDRVRVAEWAGLEALVVLLVLLAFALEAVVAVAVVAATLAAVAHVEAGVHLRQGVHAQHLVDLAEGQQPQSKLHQHNKTTIEHTTDISDQQGATVRGHRWAFPRGSRDNHTPNSPTLI